MNALIFACLLQLGCKTTQSVSSGPSAPEAVAAAGSAERQDEATKVAEGDASAEATPAGLSECGATVLKESRNAYTECFGGNDEYGACETCGYNSNPAGVQGANDCVTCPAGYEISQYYGDCTGYCVPEGTAERPLSTAQCRPNSACVVSAEPSTP